MEMEKIAASVAYALIVAGILARKNKKVHVPLMATGIGIDTLLVLILQIQRSVIQGAVMDTHTPLQYGHILASTIAFALYFPVVFLGVRQLLGRGGPNGRLWHIRLAITAFSFRSAGFVLMFSIE